MQDGLGHDCYFVVPIGAENFREGDTEISGELRNWRKAAGEFIMKSADYVLVVENDVREPNLFGGYMKLAHAPVLLGIPAELVVIPFLLDPHVRGHDLGLEVLRNAKILISVRGRD